MVMPSPSAVADNSPITAIATSGYRATELVVRPLSKLRLDIMSL
jgi:hypothetical protein